MFQQGPRPGTQPSLQRPSFNPNRCPTNSCDYFGENGFPQVGSQEGPKFMGRSLLIATCIIIFAVEVAVGWSGCFCLLLSA